MRPLRQRHLSAGVTVAHGTVADMNGGLQNGRIDNRAPLSSTDGVVSFKRKTLVNAMGSGIEMHETGKIDLSCLMDRQYALDDIEQAFDDLAAGRITRGCVVFG